MKWTYLIQHEYVLFSGSCYALHIYTYTHPLLHIHKEYVYATYTYSLHIHKEFHTYTHPLLHIHKEFLCYIYTHIHILTAHLQGVSHIYTSLTAHPQGVSTLLHTHTYFTSMRSFCHCARSTSNLPYTFPGSMSQRLWYWSHTLT